MHLKKVSKVVSDMLIHSTLSASNAMSILGSTLPLVYANVSSDTMSLSRRRTTQQQSKYGTSYQLKKG